MEAATVTLLILLLNCVTGSSSLQCSSDEYQSGENCCLKCPAGNHVETDCTDFTLRTCKTCEEGTFINQPTSLQHCFPCQRCKAGSGLRVKTPCTRTSDSLCEPLEGFYCVDSSEGKCAAAKKHSSCQPGQYISKHGSLYEDTECSECSDGSFSTTGSSSWCQPHTQCSFFSPLLIRPGNSTADAQCGIVFSGLDKVIVAVIGMLVVMVAIVEIGLFFYWLYRKRKLSEEEIKKIKTVTASPGVSLVSPGISLVSPCCLLVSPCCLLASPGVSLVSPDTGEKCDN